MIGVDTPRVLSVSIHLFRLMTEAVRLRSNEVGRFVCLTSLIADRAELARSGFEQHDTTTLSGYFATVPTNGPIDIDLQVTRSVVVCLDEATERVGTQLRYVATFDDAVSVTLFDYLMDRKAAEILYAFGLRNGAPHGQGSAHVQRVSQP